MTTFEILSISTSLFAVAVSGMAFIHGIVISKRQRGLQAQTEELQRLQIEAASRESKASQEACLNVHIARFNRSKSFVIANTGGGSAYNLRFELVDPPENPIPCDELTVFPWEELKPRQNVKILAAFHANSPSKFAVRLSWSDSSGDPREELFTVPRN